MTYLFVPLLEFITIKQIIKHGLYVYLCLQNYKHMN